MNTKAKRILQAMGLVVLIITSLTNCSWGKMNPYERDYLAVLFEEDAPWSIIDGDGNILADEEYGNRDEVSLVFDDVYWVKSNDVIQLYNVNSPKKPVTDEEYFVVTGFVNGRALVKKKDKPIEIIDADGTVIATLPKAITSITGFYKSGYAIFYNTDKDWWGFMDTDGKIILEEKCSSLTGCSEDGIYLMTKKDDMKKIDVYKLPKKKIGNLKLAKYRPISYFDGDEMGFHEGLMAVLENKNSNTDAVITFINTDLEKVFTIKKSSANQFKPGFFLDGYATYSTNEGLFGVVNKSGEELIRPKYNYLYNLGNNRFVAIRDNNYGVINAADEVILPFEYDNFLPCVLGNHYILKQGDLFYLIDKEGKEVLKDGFIVQYPFGVVSSVLYSKEQNVDDIVTSTINMINEYVNSKEDTLQFEVDVDAEEQATIYVYSKSSDGFLNIRESPSAKAQILGKLITGKDKAILLNIVGEWYKIKFNDVVGYVHSYYTRMESGTMDIDGD